jgi:hypothetical protein
MVKQVRMALGDVARDRLATMMLEAMPLTIDIRQCPMTTLPSLSQNLADQ